MSLPKKRPALGRGLDALLPASPPPRTPTEGAASAPAPSYEEGSVFRCPVERIEPQKGQPRQHFDEEKLEELAESIRTHGLIEPLVVRRRAQRGDARDVYELIAGERRWRASQRAGLKEVLVVVKDVSPRESFELALVENIQRADLDPIEVAEAYDRLVKEYGYTERKLAERLNKDRSTIANAIRLLRLPLRVRAAVVRGDLSEGHARALLGAPDDRTLEQLADKALRGKLTVRAVEKLVRNAKERAKRVARGEEPVDEKAAGGSAAIRDLEARLTRRLGTRTVVEDKKGKGRLLISYGSLDELDRLLGLLGA